MSVQAEPRVVRGFRFAGVSAGLKKKAGAKDLGLLVADQPAIAAGVFTTNRVKAAPVEVAQQRVRSGRLQAVVANSGGANCFTGKAGMKLALDSCEIVADSIRCAPELVVPCSTGVIGHLHDAGKFAAGARAAALELRDDGLADFATAIMTTDKVAKLASTSLRLGKAEINIAGTAKGAGMLAPSMATMLAFMVTDAVVTAPALRGVLGRIVPESFNAVTVDGDMSTNDTLLVLASGAAGNGALAGREAAKFEDALGEIARELARQLVFDGEGATKLVRVEVRGARSDVDARRVARQVANSPLVKTAFFGCDPNVGRILMAAGGAGAALAPERLELAIDGVRIAARGAIAVDALGQAQAAMRRREFTVRLDLKLGKGTAQILTSDLSYEYVKINAEYTT